jgi:hypothetical protein
MHRALALARLNDHTRAAAEANDLAADKTLSGESLYFLAGVYSVCAQDVHRDTRLRPSEQEERAGRYTERALELLGRAHAVGVFKAPHNVERLKQDKDLDLLRSRDEFKKLLREVEAKAKPAAK